MFPLEQYPDIIRDYLSGETTPQLGRKYNVSKKCISNILHRCGTHTRRGSAALGGLPKHMETAVVRAYASGLSMAKVGKQFSVSANSIGGVLKRHEIDIRLPWHRSRRYSLDELAFDRITDESAYWIGFLMADGCVYRKKSGGASINLALQVRDIRHIQKFQRFLHTDTPIKMRSGIPHISISSVRLADTLVRYGVIPRKSAIAKVSEDLSTNRHFWRGVVDGNGSILIMRSGRDHKLTPVLHLSGSDIMLAQFIEFASHVTHIKSKVNRGHGNIWQIQTVCGNATRLVDFLYRPGDVSLDRKMDVARRMKHDFGKYLFQTSEAAQPQLAPAKVTE